MMDKEVSVTFKLFEEGNEGETQILTKEYVKPEKELGVEVAIGEESGLLEGGK